MTETAMVLTNSMKDVFAEIGGLSEVFENDVIVLNRIIKENNVSKEIINGIKAVERIINKWKDPDDRINSYTLATNAITDIAVNDLIAKVKSLNARIKAINADEETSESIRTDLQIPHLTFGISANADVFARDIEISENGVEFSIRLRGLEEMEVCRRALVRGLAENPEHIRARIEFLGDVENHRPKCLRCGTGMIFRKEQQLDNNPMRDSILASTFDVLPVLCPSCGRYEFYDPAIVRTNKHLLYLIWKDTKK